MSASRAEPSRTISKSAGCISSRRARSSWANRCQSQGETARPAQGGLGNIQARRQAARHPGAGARMSPRPPSPRYWTSPAPPSTTSSRPARSLPADPKTRTALMLYFNTNVGATLTWRRPHERPAGPAHSGPAWRGTASVRQSAIRRRTLRRWPAIALTRPGANGRRRGPLFPHPGRGAG